VHALLAELTRIQDRAGYLPEDELRLLAERVELPLHRLNEVASFFPHLHLAPPARVEVGVCQGLACHLHGSRDLLDRLAQAAERMDGVEVSGCSCQGRCDRGPTVSVTRHGGSPAGHVAYYLGRTPEEVLEATRAPSHQEAPPPDTDADHTNFTVDWKIDPYDGVPTYAQARALAEALAVGAVTGQRARQEVLHLLEEAGLLGMGGAGGRVYKKWSEVLAAAGKRKFVVCNADESEPGTFKDRELLLRTPHLTLEGMIIAGLLVGAERGYVYIRHEYQEQIEAVRRAITRSEELGASGPDVFGTGLAFPLEVFVSPGGYICGEQTALIEAIEGKRAEPRNRPPELQTNGLWDCPTLLNNVESFAWVPTILHEDRERWELGDPFRGRRLFSVSGDVERPGVYEVPNGTRLGALLELAGGIRGGREMKAVAPSGPSGGFLPRLLPVGVLTPAYRELMGLGEDATHFDLLEWELDIARTRKMGENMNIMLGAGIVFYGSGVNMVPEARAASEFYRNESCGKCVPCRLGTQRLVEVYDRMDAGEITIDELYAEGEGTVGQDLGELADAIEATAICGLGQVSLYPLTTLRRFFRADIEAHLQAVASEGSRA
jgi:NADH:ubiquinone oxidoreductase subunit F (NADH-binding)